jgi:hypothetical protein
LTRTTTDNYDDEKDKTKDMGGIDLAGSGNDNDDGVLGLDGEDDETEVAATAALDATNRLSSAREFCRS